MEGLAVSGGTLLLLYLCSSAHGFLISNAGAPSECEHNEAFIKLVSLPIDDMCMNVDNVFSLLKRVNTETSDTCRHWVITFLADSYSRNQNTPSYCKCRGNNTYVHYYSGVMEGVSDLKDTTCKNYRSYTVVYNLFFENGHRIHSCRTHHAIWDVLDDIADYSWDCQKEIIYHIEYSYHQVKDPCSCQIDSKTCTHIQTYNDILARASGSACYSANSMWQDLNKLEAENARCRIKLQRQLGERFRRHNETAYVSDACQCTSSHNLHNTSFPHLQNGHIYPCTGNEGGFADLREKLFEKSGDIGCVNQNYLWTQLDHVRPDIVRRTVYDCASDLIRRSVQIYTDPSKDPCSCTPKPMTTTPATQPPTTTATVTPYACDRLKVIGDIAHGDHLTAANADDCNVLERGTSEEYLLATCNVSQPATWTRGAQVLPNCNNIPLYTPISSFGADSTFHVHGSQPGILMQCDTDGFYMAVERCKSPPEVLHITLGGYFHNDPMEYYVIM